MDAPFPTLLWDLLKPARRRAGAKARQAAPAQRRGPTPRQRRYDALVAEMKQRYDIRIRRWRSSTSGCAWETSYRDGSSARWIEAPYPRGPMSCAVFLHEVGHHAIGFHRYKPRCLEEYMAWRWALREMRERGFDVTARVQRRVDQSLKYAVIKARRRGLKRLPRELERYAA